jgi:hypothetical protein
MANTVTSQNIDILFCIILYNIAKFLIKKIVCNAVLARGA